MTGEARPVALRLERPFRKVEEFTLLSDKVRLEWRRPFASGVTEIPLRFLDATWAAQKGTGRLGHLLAALAATLLAAGGILIAWGALDSDSRVGVALVIAFVWALMAPALLVSWWASRYDIVVFTNLHPQYGPLVMHRTKEKELETLQFADAVSERIRILAMTKPEG